MKKIERIDNDPHSVFFHRDLLPKINELVDAVNELRNAHRPRSTTFGELEPGTWFRHPGQMDKFMKIEPVRVEPYEKPRTTVCENGGIWWTEDNSRVEIVDGI